MTMFKSPQAFQSLRNVGRKSLLQSVLATTFAVAAFAPASSMAQVQNDPGHWHNAQGVVWKNSTGLCWHSGFWTPGDASAECGPEPMKAEAAVPQLAKAAEPAAVPAPAPKPQTRKVSFAAEELFDFDKSALRPAGKAALDKLVGELDGVDYESILVSGHTDRLGSHQYNQKLSERRAATVNSYLVSKGIPDSRTTSAGNGESQPVTKIGDCKGPLSKKLIACLQPDRRVDVAVSGSREVTVAQ
jgi:OmpA-OmpF porin, OOP family